MLHSAFLRLKTGKRKSHLCWMALKMQLVFVNGIKECEGDVTAA